MATAESTRNSERESAKSWFATTHWSVVLEAGRNGSPASSAALEKLCRTYWYPLYTYIRSRGYRAHEAQDLTQEFFARFLAKNYLGVVDRTKGKFRSFLLASLNHFLTDEWDKARAAKRGGGQTHISLDDENAEKRYLLEPATELSAEELFEQRWALTLLDQALSKLREELAAARKAEHFDALKPFLDRQAQPGDYDAVAAQLQMTNSAVAMAVSRLRQKYAALVRAEIAQTVCHSDEIEEELRHLFEAISG